MGKYKIKNFTRKEIVQIEASFKGHSEFIGKILKDFPHQPALEYEGYYEKNDAKGYIDESKLYPKIEKKKSGRTIEELHVKLSNLKNKSSRLVYKEKLVKKGLKNRIKKKEKKEAAVLRRRETKAAKKGEAVAGEEKPVTKPVYNSEGNMVFSKFDFSELGAKAKRKGIVKDPEVALKKVKEQEEKLKELEDKGLKAKVNEIKEKKAWKTALLKSEGVKIKDNPELLKATIKKVKKRKEKSEARWKAQKKKVEKEKDEKQKKRLANIQDRSRAKKVKKMKSMAKKGRMIAGF